VGTSVGAAAASKAFGTATIQIPQATRLSLQLQLHANAWTPTEEPRVNDPWLQRIRL